MPATPGDNSTVSCVPLVFTPVVRVVKPDAFVVPHPDDDETTLTASFKLNPVPTRVTVCDTPALNEVGEYEKVVCTGVVAVISPPAIIT